MIGGWKATIVVPISIEFVRTMGESAAQRYVADANAGDWMIRGPRGGRYIAGAAQVTAWHLDREQFFRGGEWRFLGHRKDIRYVRPGSRAAEPFGDRP